MRIYLDTSAFIKLVKDEDESAALVTALQTDYTGPRISSLLLETEARRAAHRSGVPQAHVTHALSGVHLADAPRSLFIEAGLLPGPVRSLDAIHLATAIRNAAIRADRLRPATPRRRKGARHPDRVSRLKPHHARGWACW